MSASSDRGHCSVYILLYRGTVVRVEKPFKFSFNCTKLLSMYLWVACKAFIKRQNFAHWVFKYSVQCSLQVRACRQENRTPGSVWNGLFKAHIQSRFLQNCVLYDLGNDTLALIERPWSCSYLLEDLRLYPNRRGGAALLWLNVKNEGAVSVLTLQCKKTATQKLTLKTHTLPRLVKTFCTVNVSLSISHIVVST